MNMNMDKFIKEEHRVVVAEMDVINTLKAINEHHRFPPKMRVGSCGWVNSNKWFIYFTTTRAIWKELINDLNIVRVFENDDIPDKQVGVVYSTD